ncbi:MAG: Stp1/IreP family PP2C-type Ser/Thr phosphatase [Solirubrobacteraceae bacterium]
MLRVADKAAETDPGRLRRNNEDSYFSRSPLFVIADGMGGAQAGEVASAKVVEVFEHGLPDAGGPPEERLAALITEANARVYELSTSDRELQGMGTTTTAVYVGEEEIALAHVGDSRAYLLREGLLERLTDDHTLVEELVRQGRITAEEAEGHPQRSIVTRSVGPESEVQVDRMTLRGRDGDVFLICSDGLTSMISEAAVADILRDARSLDAAARALVRAANDAGGRDNITVVLFRLEDVDTGSTADDRTMVGETAPSTAEVRAAVEAAGPPQPVPAEPAADVAPRSPRPPREVRSEKRRRRGWVALVVTVILLLPILGGAYIASQAVFFLGVASNGSVTVFQGLPYDLPFGLHLYTSAYVTGLTPEQLPANRREDLLDHKLRSHDDAFDLAKQLELGQLDS